MKTHLNAVAVAVGIAALLALSLLSEARLSAQITGQTPVPTAPPAARRRVWRTGSPIFKGCGNGRTCRT